MGAGKLFYPKMVLLLKKLEQITPLCEYYAHREQSVAISSCIVKSTRLPRLFRAKRRNPTPPRNDVCSNLDS